MNHPINKPRRRFIVSSLAGAAAGMASIARAVQRQQAGRQEGAPIILRFRMAGAKLFGSEFE